MKIKLVLWYILVVSLGSYINVSFGHDIPVHWAITLNSAESALNTSPAYGSFIGVISSDLFYSGLSGVTNAMKDGSGFEDNRDINGDAGGKRSLNHFYDPLDYTYGKGLSDSPPDRRIVAGTNSFAWSSISNCMGYNFPGVTWLDLGKNENTKNIWSWQNARGYEWIGLTAINQSERQAYMLNMFRAVGQVMHLLEDTSQPQHVRNEQHLDQIFGINTAWRSPIEDYGAKYVSTLNYQHALLDWKSAGFNKLEDFWDRHLYNGDATALNNAENGGAQLGLAEWCNGNFISDRHQYAEYFDADPNNIAYYPYPDLHNSTDYISVFRRLHFKARTSFLKSGIQIKRLYLDKQGAGIVFNDHSVFNYFGAYFASRGFEAYSTSIRDYNVLSNYHNQFIPKAVKYSAGLLDYFFRGTMDVGLVIDTNAGIYSVTNINTSGQDFYGGTFSLFWETGGVRSLAGSADWTGQILTNGGSMNFNFTGPPPVGARFFSVYQGTIGYSNGAALDPVDTNIAIAVGRPWVEQTATYDYQPTLDELGLPPGATITTNLESDDFGFAITPGNYEVKVEFSSLDDTGTIGGLTCQSRDDLACENGAWNDVITNAVVPVSGVTVTPDGQHLSVYVTATDDSSCSNRIGWRNTTITWRAWPASGP